MRRASSQDRRPHFRGTRRASTFALSGSIAPLLPSKLDEADAIVSADLLIVTGFDDEESEVSLLVSSRASARTRALLRRTGELGRVSLKNVGSGGGGDSMTETVPPGDAQRSRPDREPDLPSLWVRISATLDRCACHHIRGAQDPLTLRPPRRSPPTAARAMHHGVERKACAFHDATASLLTPHPAALGSPLMHPNITTDFSESQPELVTGVLTPWRRAGTELTPDSPGRLSRSAMHAVGAAAVRAASRQNLVARFGSSNVGRARASYAWGCGCTAGACRPSRAFTTTGRCRGSATMITALIRNFRRHSSIAADAFGASPAVCQSSSRTANTSCGGCQKYTLYPPHATSLPDGPARLSERRAGRAGGQLQQSWGDYAGSLLGALTRPSRPTSGSASVAPAANICN